eukprot:RCo005746
MDKLGGRSRDFAARVQPVRLLARSDMPPSPTTRKPWGLSPSPSAPVRNSAHLFSTATLVTAVMVVANIVATVGLVLMNKRLFVVHNFQFPSFVILCHQITAVLFTRTLVATGLMDPKHDLPWMTKMQIAVSDVATLVFINRSLLFNTVGTYQVLKFLNIPCMCVIESMMGTSYATALLASLGVLIAGVGMATVTEVQFSVEGCICGCCAALFTAFHQILIKRAKDKHELGPLQIMHRQAPPTALLLVFTSLSTDNVPMLLTYTPTFWAMTTLILTCLLAVLVIWTVVTLVTRTSPVTFQVIGLMKTCLTFVLGFLMFRNPVTRLNILGILIATVGFAMYTYLKLPSGHPPSIPETVNTPSESGVSEVVSEESKDDE